MRTKLKTAAGRVSARMNAAERYAESRVGDRFDTSTVAGRVAQTGTVLTVVTLGITILVGILIYDQVYNALSISDAQNKDAVNRSSLENASVESTDTFGQAMELAPVIMIILLAAVVLAVVQRFR